MALPENEQRFVHVDIIRLDNKFVQIFSVILAAICSQPFEMRPILLQSEIQCLVGFPGRLKYVTFNDLEMPFYVKNCFLFSDCQVLLISKE